MRDQAASEVSTTDPLRIRADADSASASGVHAIGALSQYNMCREGIVFSNGETFDIPLRCQFDDETNQTHSRRYQSGEEEDTFAHMMELFHSSLVHLAHEVCVTST